MIILELFDGDTHKLNLPDKKEKVLFDLWYKTMNQKIKLTMENGETLEIKLSDISNCLIGNDAKKYSDSYIEKNNNDIDGGYNMLKDLLDKFNL